MSDENKIQEYPIVAVGPLIYREDGKILLIKGPKFGEYWTIPGGKVNVGETVEAALRREVKEELDVELGAVEFAQYQDAINPPSYNKPKHFIFVDFFAEIKNGEPKTSEEISEFKWVDVVEAQSMKLSPSVIKLLEQFVNKNKKTVVNEDYKANYQRAIADYQNFKKEVDARRAEWVAMSELQILEDFIPVYDNFKKAFSHHPNTSGDNEKQLKGWIDGIGYIMKQFAEVMKNHNLEEIKTVGEKFDITRHESAGEEEVAGKNPGEIVREVDGGYTMSGKVIKVAKVIIAK